MRHQFTHHANVFTVEWDEEEATFNINALDYSTDDEDIISALNEYDGGPLSLREIPGWDMLIDDARDLIADTIDVAMDDELTHFKAIQNQQRNPSAERAQFFTRAGYDTSQKLCAICGPPP